MRRALTCSLAALAAGLAPAAAAGAAAARTATNAHHAPTPAEIHRAVARARRSSYLWATVNICLPRPHHGGVIGVRGEMPALGLRSTLSMTIQLRQYLATKHRFVDVTGTTARRTVTLGALRSGIHQDGAEFPYRSDTGVLSAEVTFTWVRDGRRLAQVMRATTGGHPSAAYGEPAGHSTARCTL
jgi:hypothetical protein